MADPETVDPTAYDNADFIPGGDAYWARWERDAAAFRARHGTARLDLPYGAHPREAADLFLPRATPAGLVVFVHGGFWQAGGRALWSHLAAGPVGAGWACALPSYPLCPEVPIADITRAVARAVTSLAAQVAGPILLAGHSAGGHLALRMVCPDTALPPAVAGRIAGVLAISPLADLAPLIPLPMNDDLHLDAARARAESPAHHPAPSVPVLVEVGAAERPAFLDQAFRITDAWPAAALTLAAHRHHFDVIDPLCEPDSPMVRRLLALAT